MQRCRSRRSEDSDFHQAVDNEQLNDSLLSTNAVGHFTDVHNMDLPPLYSENCTESANNLTAGSITWKAFVSADLTNEPEVDPKTLWQYKRGTAILQYAPPFLIVMATVGNIMSVITLQHPTFRKSSTSFILSALAIVDLLIVHTGLMRQWLVSQFNIDVRLFSSFSCKFHTFLVYCVPMISSWTVVLLTIERVISVWMPLKCKELCSRPRIIVAWCVFVVIMMAINCHFFVVMDLYFVPDDNTPGSDLKWNCYFLMRYLNFMKYKYFWIDACVRSFIPFIIISTGNCFIVSRILIANRHRKCRMQAVRDKDNSVKGSKIASSTATLIVVSIIFLMLNLPRDTYYSLVSTEVFTSSTAEVYAVSWLIYSCINLPMYTNHSINFLMYFFSGRKFRLAANETITCQWCREKRRQSENLHQPYRRQ